MATFSAAVRTTNNTAAAAAAEIRSTSANKPRILEVTGSQTDAATNPAVMGVGRSAAVGTNPTTVTVQDEQDGNSVQGLTTVATAWTTGPTVPATFQRRWSFNNGIGIGFLYLFPRGMSLAVSTSVVFWNIATSTPSFWDLLVQVDE